MQLLDLRGTSGPFDALPRAAHDLETAREIVAPIVRDVKERGLTAVLDATRTFDQVELDEIRVAQSDIDAAWATTSPELRAAIAESIARVTEGHSAQMPRAARTEFGPGAAVEQLWKPVERVGLYAPGGLAAYASSVVMNVVPAQVAGVRSIAVSSPPQRGTGLPAVPVLAACAALGITELYAVGGAQAIAAMAYGVTDAAGVEVMRAVDVITGPGNVYVAAAKSLVRGSVGIDSEAGPTEIMIIADESADPLFIAADLISQAEHDPLAAAVLVTTSEVLAREVLTQLGRLVPRTANAERVAAALEGVQSMIVLVDDLTRAVELANAYGAEHLEVMTSEPRATADQITNAGAIFLGQWSPVSLGDYAAGSNHVLPTSGNSRFSSGLSVQAFLRPVQLIDYDEGGLRAIADAVIAFANAERLPAHGEAVSIRLR
jgi:histidinol dehydrogenase